MVVGDSTKVGDAGYCTYFGKSPHETLLTCWNDDSQRNGKNRFYDASQAIAPTNQKPIWKACEIELTVIYTDASLSIGNENVRGVGKVRY